MSFPSSIRRRDSNPRPLEREPPPITTRPGLPPYNTLFGVQPLWSTKNSKFSSTTQLKRNTLFQSIVGSKYSTLKLFYEIGCSSNALNRFVEEILISPKQRIEKCKIMVVF